jgi:hypothetical protein
VSPGAKLSGRIVVEGSTTSGAELKNVGFSLARVGGLRVPALSLPPKINPDGTFTFSSVAPGTYRISVDTTKLAGWRAKSAVTRGVDVLDTPIDLTAGENVTDVTVTLDDRHSEITGMLRDSTGRVAPDYILIVFSADRRLWGPQSRRTQCVRPGRDGQYIVRDLPAGDYLIAALTDVEQGEWNSADFLSDISARGVVRVSLADGEKKLQDLGVRVGAAQQ